ncbi:hypothetical protein [Blastopirellula marina]|uniref:Uncharacterized protein n=1 Tax=Blastopirellula marina DSM 3645 TaxID=314230 RepID=A3ZU98_9BACT|nr:hypothetical protein [Blastopirellula marina]EAQ79801.1 hypothetical protein DSM3645_21714 [Blastopirellula marina DSM 3645]
MFKPGDPVVYRKTKHTTHPGPRAHDIDPEPRGEFYTYDVDKYWVIEQIDQEAIVVRTRRGKTHAIRRDDTRLRAANWWERFFLRGRFPGADAGLENTT